MSGDSPAVAFAEFVSAYCDRTFNGQRTMRDVLKDLFDEPDRDVQFELLDSLLADVVSGCCTSNTNNPGLAVLVMARLIDNPMGTELMRDIVLVSLSIGAGWGRHQAAAALGSDE